MNFIYYQRNFKFNFTCTSLAGLPVLVRMFSLYL